MKTTKEQQKQYLTVGQWCDRWQISRRKFDYLKQAGALAGIIQQSPRLIRIKADLADQSMERYMLKGGKQ